MKIKKKEIRKYQKNLIKQIPKDLGKKIPLVASGIRALEETTKQIKEEKRDKILASIHSKVSDIKKNKGISRGDLEKAMEKITKPIQKIKKRIELDIGKNKEKYRDEKEILAELDTFFDKMWYDRHQMIKNLVKLGKTKVNPTIWKGALKAEKKIIKKYGKKNLGPWTDFEWGMLNGKLSALRWLLGDDWDILDT